jgi:hypothetical protein
LKRFEERLPFIFIFALAHFVLPPPRLIDQSFWLSKSAMKKLPTSTIRRLRTATVIVDVHSVVKELVENALDAGTPPPRVR